MDYRCDLGFVSFFLLQLCWHYALINIQSECSTVIVSDAIKLLFSNWEAALVLQTKCSGSDVLSLSGRRRYYVVML